MSFRLCLSFLSEVTCRGGDWKIDLESRMIILEKVGHSLDGQYSLNSFVRKSSIENVSFL